MAERQVQKLSLSICIPAYNRPTYLKRAIKSILTTPIAQQAQIEIIISDDSTTFKCREVVEALMPQWKGSWKYSINSPSLGMAKNWNHSIKMASSNYVLILHDDDYLEPEALAIVLDTIKHNPNVSALLFGVQVVTFQQKIIKRQAVKSQKYLSPAESLEQILIDSSYVRFPGMVIKRNVFAEVGYFDENIGEIADIQMWIRVCHKHGLLCVPSITSNYSVHRDTLTMDMFNNEIIKKLESLFESVKPYGILSLTTIEKCKANYFHQFILAGTVRYLKVRELRKSIQVFDLFSNLKIRNSLVRKKWKLIRFLLRIFLDCVDFVVLNRQSAYHS